MVNVEKKGADNDAVFDWSSTGSVKQNNASQRYALCFSFPTIKLVLMRLKWTFEKKGWFWWDGSWILRGLTTVNEHQVATFNH